MNPNEANDSMYPPGHPSRRQRKHQSEQPIWATKITEVAPSGTPQPPQFVRFLGWALVSVLLVLPLVASLWTILWFVKSARGWF